MTDHPEVGTSAPPADPEVAAAGDNVVADGAFTGAGGSGAADDPDAGPIGTDSGADVDREPAGDIEREPAGAAGVFGDRIDLARRYVSALATDGVVRGLIGPREPGRLWTRHVLNCAAAAGLIEPGSTVVDIGSGAGLPGIPLAIARPDLTVTLVEPLERRVRFLLEIVEALHLDNVRVVRGRADEVVGSSGGADVVTSRAVAPLHRLAAWSAPLARPGGVVLALKGETAADELQRDRKAVTAAGLVEPEVIELNGAVEDGVDTTYVIRATRAVGGPVRSDRQGRSAARPARRGRR